MVSLHPHEHPARAPLRAFCVDRVYPTRTSACIGCAAIFMLTSVSLSFAQAGRGSQRPEFSAASVKLSIDPAGSSGLYGMHGGPGTATPGSIRFGRIPLFQLVAKAYGISPELVSGPSWTRDFSGSNWYDITATLPPDTTPEEFRGMLQSLLEERFELKVHRERKSAPGYQLILASSGHKLRPAAIVEAGEKVAASRSPSFDAEGKILLPSSQGVSSVMTKGLWRLGFRGVTVDELAQRLGRILKTSSGGGPDAAVSPVVNMTGINGYFDFTLNFACEACEGLRPDSPVVQARQPRMQEELSSDPSDHFPRFSEALQQQLGLRLVRAREVSTEVLVIDHAIKLPNRN